MLKRLLSALPELMSAYATTVGMVIGVDAFADFLTLRWVQIFAVSGTLVGVLGRSPIVSVIKRVVEGGDKPASGE